MRVNEQSPLLPRPEDPSQADEAGRQPVCPTQFPPDNGRDGSPPVFPLRDIIHCAVVILVIVLIESSALLLAVPLNQILEANICRRLHPELKHQSAAACGNDSDVQAELALVNGWSITLTLLPGIITAIPFGFLADKYGRKLGMCLCVLGICMFETCTAAVCSWPDVFPYRLVWLSPIFLAIGGGVTILSSLLFSTLSDLAPDAYRANTFFALGAATLVTELLVNPLASNLMQKNVWLPIFIAMSLFVPTMAIALALPETLPRAVEAGDGLGDSLSDHDAGQDGQEHNTDQPDGGRRGWWAKLSGLVPEKQMAAALFVWGNQQLVMLMLTLLTTTLGKMVQEILSQFTHTRFGWSWAKAAYLGSFKAALTLSVLVVFLPAVNYAFTTMTSLSPKRRDLALTRLNCALLLLGYLIIGLAPTVPWMLSGLAISCFGSPYSLVLRSLLAQLVEPHHRAILFTSIAFLENIGGLISGPLLAVSFRIGIKLGGLWNGLPFLAASVLFATTLIVLYSIRVV